MMADMTLESLHAMSTEALRELAARFALDLPEGLERSFIIEEIIDVQEESLKAPEEDPVPEADFKEVELDIHKGSQKGKEAPKGSLQDRRYNENIIRALLKDPSWAFIFWDVRDEESRSTGEHEERSLSIRVLELSSPQDPPQNAVSWFEFPIAPKDRDWYVNLPEDGFCYVFELAMTVGKERRLLARTNALSVPRCRRSQDFERLPRRTRSLMELAGLWSHMPAPEDSSTRGKGRRIMPIDDLEG